MKRLSFRFRGDAFAALIAPRYGVRLVVMPHHAAALPGGPAADLFEPPSGGAMAKATRAAFLSFAEKFREVIDRIYGRPASLWDLALAALDGALAIGPQPAPFTPETERRVAVFRAAVGA